MQHFAGVLKQLGGKFSKIKRDIQPVNDDLREQLG